MKRTRQDELILKSDDTNRNDETQLIEITRQSSLLESNYQLVGHKNAVNCIEFDESGNLLASGSSDSDIRLWNIFGGCDNTLIIKDLHKLAITDIKFDEFYGGDYIYSSSADKTIGIYNIEQDMLVKKLHSHTEIVNSISTLHNMLASCSDDKTCKVFNIKNQDAKKTKTTICTITQDSPITACVLAEIGAGYKIITGSIDNKVRVYDLRKNDKALYELNKSTDIISGLAVSTNEESLLLTNSMDGLLNVYDIAPFSSNNDRCLRTLQYSPKNIEKNLLKCNFAKNSSSIITAGTADRKVSCFNIETGEILLNNLPGHQGAVMDVHLHPKYSQNEPIIASCSLDHTIIVGEVDRRLFY